jgi:hypothetical protein
VSLEMNLSRIPYALAKVETMGDIKTQIEAVRFSPFCSYLAFTIVLADRLPLSFDYSCLFSLASSSSSPSRKRTDSKRRSKETTIDRPDS